MKPFIKNAVSYFREGAEAHHLTATDSLHDAIVSGYSYASAKNQHESSPQSCDHRLVGILYADITNYSHLNELDEEGTHHRLVESIKIIEAYVIANNGSVAHLADDAILAEFKDADNALNCAINVQLVAQKLNAHLHSDQQVLFRIGVNFGDVIADQDDISDYAVNLAARLERLAHSGGICVSESVKQRLNNHPSFNFVAMGEQYVKNISEPVKAFWIEFDSQQVGDLSLTGAVKKSAVAS